MVNESYFEEARKQDKRMSDYFVNVKHLDSLSFVEIPQVELVDVNDYRFWLVNDLEMKWMVDFNGNKYWRPGQGMSGWNDEGGIGGSFGENRFSNCKLYHFDGTEEPFFEDDWGAKRGFLIRDHYSESDVVKVHMIADNLCEFLTQENINHKRINFGRETRKPI